jgi:hypothetical protein
MDDAVIDFDEVLRRAHERCKDLTPCLECLTSAAAEVILDWLEGRSSFDSHAWPMEEEIAV